MANSPRPGVFALERSTDYGKTWAVWQYFADTYSDCFTFFGDRFEDSITRDNSVICTTDYSHVVPLEGGEVCDFFFLENSDDFTDIHDDVIKWKHFPRNWPFVRGIHRSPVNSPHKGQWRGALMFSLICARINGWVNTGDAGDLRRHRIHNDVIVMFLGLFHWHWGNHMITTVPEKQPWMIWIKLAII